ncbi:MAG TPA: hypothetical protein VLC08_07435 [Chitinolyticbacter sp.]|nr:hypothetical protein [Chitinolyticbacter sp.]
MLTMTVVDHRRALHAATMPLALLLPFAALPWAWEVAGPMDSSWQLLKFIVACMIALLVWIALLGQLNVWASHARMTFAADGVRSRVLGFLPLSEIQRVRVWWLSEHDLASREAQPGASQRLRLETTRGSFDYTVHPPCDVDALKAALAKPRLLWRQAPAEFSAVIPERLVLAMLGSWKAAISSLGVMIAILFGAGILMVEFEDEAIWIVVMAAIVAMVAGGSVSWLFARDEVMLTETGFHSRRNGEVRWGDVTATRLSIRSSNQAHQQELAFTLKDGRTIGFVYYFSGKQFGHLVEACRRQKLL